MKKPNKDLVIRRLQKAFKVIYDECAYSGGPLVQNSTFYVEQVKDKRAFPWAVMARFCLSSPPEEIGRFDSREAAEFFVWATVYAQPFMWLSMTLLNSKMTPAKLTAYLNEWEISHAGGWRRVAKELERKNRKKG